ncbi:hypothetical protein GGI07_005681, partial [Coemansia sp. Benny D115]
MASEQAPTMPPASDDEHQKQNAQTDSAGAEKTYASVVGSSSADRVNLPEMIPLPSSIPSTSSSQPASSVEDNSHQDAEEQHIGDSQQEDEYTTDSYTEDDYTDEYAEESVFSDSNYSGASEFDDSYQYATREQQQQHSQQHSQQPATRNYDSNSIKLTNRRMWTASSEEASGLAAVAPSSAVFDTHFSSGATSPSHNDAIHATRTTDALAPVHRFVSHTPWGSSTGRLTRGQRDKGRLWDDPHMAVGSEKMQRAEEAEEEAYGRSGLPMFDEQHARATSAGSAVAHSALSPPQNSAGSYAQAGSHNPNGSHIHGSSSEAYPRGMSQYDLQQQQQQQYQSSWPSGANAHPSQVVNVVSVQQGTKGYNQLQQQMQREQKLQQDTIEGKLLQGQNAPRIVTIAQFIKSVSRLLGIGFPSAGCTEARLTVALVAVLGVRTGLDVWFSNFNARTVRAVVTYDRATLLRRLLPEYLAMTLPMAAVNQAIKWVISSLTIALRVRLGRYAHERYVDGITNITWSQLHHQGPNGSTPAFERPDWLLTVQIHRFADMLPRLIADVVKPTMDWFVFSRLLSRVIGRKGSITMVLYVVLANIIIRISSPPTGKHASRLAQLEEKYRGVYARVSSIIQRAAAASTPIFFQQNQQRNSQPHMEHHMHQKQQPADIISPDPSPHPTTPHGADLRMNGTKPAFVPRVQAAFRQRAHEALDSSLDNVASGVVSTNIRRFFGGIGESMLAKYGATLTAYYLLAMPLCTPGRRLASEILHDPAAVMMSYSRNSAYLINLSQATTRLLLMVNDLPKFVWSTVKVDRLLRSLDVHARYRSAVENIPTNDESSYTTE